MHHMTVDSVHRQQNCSRVIKRTGITQRDVFYALSCLILRFPREGNCLRRLHLSHSFKRAFKSFVYIAPEDRRTSPKADTIPPRAWHLHTQSLFKHWPVRGILLSETPIKISKAKKRIATHDPYYRRYCKLMGYVDNDVADPSQDPRREQTHCTKY